jgi:hypothetical protein
MKGLMEARREMDSKRTLVGKEAQFISKEEYSKPQEIKEGSCVITPKGKGILVGKFVCGNCKVDILGKGMVDFEDMKDIVKTDEVTAKFANFFGYSDVEPYEIVKVISNKTLVVRAMDSKPEPKAQEKLNKSFVPGGFVGHFENSLQGWIITSNVNNKTQRIRLGKKGWKGSCGRFVLSNHPIKHYDFNF